MTLNVSIPDTVRMMQQAFYLTLEVVSFLDAEHSRHSHERYTAEYSILFGERSYYRHRGKTESNYKRSRSNYFVLTVLKNETKRYLGVCVAFGVVLTLWGRTDAFWQRIMRKHRKICVIALLICIVLYYFDIISLSVPGYWPYLRSLVPVAFCDKFLQEQVLTRVNNEINAQNPAPVKIVLLLLESFPVSMILQEGRIDSSAAPFLAQYAQHNTFYESVYTGSTPTCNSLFGIFSGLTAQQRVLSIVDRFGWRYPGVFGDLKDAGYDLHLFLPYHSHFDKLDAFQYLFDEIHDGISAKHAGQYKWAPDRIRSREVADLMAENASQKQVIVYATAEAHYPFHGFDDSVYYENGEPDHMRSIIRYLDDCIQIVVESAPADALVIITGDHGNGFCGKDDAECEFGTFGVISGETQTIKQAITHAELLEPLYQVANSEMRRSVMVENGFHSYALESGLLRRSTWRERYANDCAVQYSGLPGDDNYYATWAIAYLQLLFIYNNVFVLLSVYEIEFAERPVVVKQRQSI